MQVGSDIYTIDCYAPAEYAEADVLVAKGSARTGLMGKTLHYVIAALALMNAGNLGDGVYMGYIYVVLALAVSYNISVVPVFNRVIGLDWCSANDKG